MVLMRGVNEVTENSLTAQTLRRRPIIDERLPGPPPHWSAAGTKSWGSSCRSPKRSQLAPSPMSTAIDP